MAFTRSIAVVEVAGFHHAEHGAEQFGAMREAARLHAPFHAGADEVRIVVDVQPRHDGPLFAGLELFEPGFEHAGRRPDQRAHLSSAVPRRNRRAGFRPRRRARRGIRDRDRLRSPGSAATWPSTFGRCG